MPLYKFSSYFANINASALANNSSSNPIVEKYYTSFESRLEYRFLFENACYCSIWKHGTIWPFPISKAQHAIKKKLYSRLGLGNNSKVLDASAGLGVIAIYIAKRGLEIVGINLTPMHIANAAYNVKIYKKVLIELEDYYNLSRFNNNFFDEIYIMETFVYANNSNKVLQNFSQVLKHNSVVVLYKADFQQNLNILQQVLHLFYCQNVLKKGFYEKMLENVEFSEITVKDLTNNVFPLWRLFEILKAVLYNFL